jgi:enoyl-CoA hydratase/carnithine racemase
VELAGEIASNAPLSLKGNKQALRTLRAHALSLPEDVARQLVELRESCFRSEDFREGVKSFAEKRPPEWKDR